VVLDANENLNTVWGALMEYGGAAAYTTPTGSVRVVDNPGIPAETSAIVYARGATSAEFGITDAQYSTASKAMRA